MYNIFKTVIQTKKFELAQMLKKIDEKWIDDTITDEQRRELSDLARSNANPENSYANIQEQINALLKEIKVLKDEIDLIKGNKNENKEDYPEYKQPLGAHDAYKQGDKISHKGTKYICVAPSDTVVVWGPKVMPNYWQEQ